MKSAAVAVCSAWTKCRWNHSQLRGAPGLVRFVRTQGMVYGTARAHRAPTRCHMSNSCRCPTGALLLEGLKVYMPSSKPIIQQPSANTKKEKKQLSRRQLELKGSQSQQLICQQLTHSGLMHLYREPATMGGDLESVVSHHAGGGGRACGRATLHACMNRTLCMQLCSVGVRPLCLMPVPPPTLALLRVEGQLGRVVWGKHTRTNASSASCWETPRNN